MCIYNTLYLGVILFCASQSLYPIFMLLSMLFRQSKLLYPFFHKFKEGKSHGGKLVAEVLSNHGVPHIFTLPGGHVSPILVAADELKIKVIDVRHEATAVFAADATARISGTTGVAVVTAGPGLTNTVTAIKNAQLAESPVVVIAGASATMLRGRGSLQDIDQMSLLKSTTKQCFSVDCVREIVPTLREAFRVSQVGVPGPVFVELPIDTLYSHSIVAQQFASMSKPTTTFGKEPAKLSIKQRIVNAYANYRLNYLFADAFEECDKDPLPVTIKSATPAQIKQIANLLLSARRPLIIAGSQCTQGPFGGEKLAEKLKKLNVPIYVNGSARGMMGSDYEFQFRHARKNAVKEADCVLLLGAICDFRLSYGQIFNKSSKIISVNRSLSQAKLNSGIFWSPTLTVEADIGKFGADLEKCFSSTKAKSNNNIDSEWIETLEKREVEKESSILSMSSNESDRYLNPLKVLTEFRTLLEKDKDKDTVLIADGGDFVATASYIVKPNRPLRWLDPGPYGTLGCGAGFALAAKLLLPDARVVAIMGDGAFGYAIPELDTFVRHKLPTYWLIGNDACWTQIKREQVPMLGSPIGCELAYTDYDKVAQGFGAAGYKVSDTKDLVTTLSKSLINLDSNTTVVNAFIGKTKFREGSISV